jgi:hypothetical protein
MAQLDPKRSFAARSTRSDSGRLPTGSFRSSHREHGHCRESALRVERIASIHSSEDKAPRID